MIDVKQAIQSAKAYAAEVLGIGDLLLEEVRSHPDAFDITLSFPERRTPDFVNPMTRRSYEGREYKTFEVNKQSGAVQSMSIRQIA
jgi:hypothetical protein